MFSSAPEPNVWQGPIKTTTRAFKRRVTSTRSRPSAGSGWFLLWLRFWRWNIEIIRHDCLSVCFTKTTTTTSTLKTTEGINSLPPASSCFIYTINSSPRSLPETKPPTSIIRLLRRKRTEQNLNTNRSTEITTWQGPGLNIWASFWIYEDKTVECFWST